eukprot:GHVO01010000.1.p1 GENE.GHVO01010000.1~~GHVO01010000.1.p1  ORF type:complete len:491 (+),score=87.59 GHVO01010000.1:698-2170(+)
MNPHVLMPLQAATVYHIQIMKIHAHQIHKKIIPKKQIIKIHAQKINQKTVLNLTLMRRRPHTPINAAAALATLGMGYLNRMNEDGHDEMADSDMGEERMEEARYYFLKNGTISTKFGRYDPTQSPSFADTGQGTERVKSLMDLKEFMKLDRGQQGPYEHRYTALSYRVNRFTEERVKDLDYWTRRTKAEGYDRILHEQTIGVHTAIMQMALKDVSMEAQMHIPAKMFRREIMKGQANPRDSKGFCLSPMLKVHMYSNSQAPKETRHEDVHYMVYTVGGSAEEMRSEKYGRMYTQNRGTLKDTPAPHAPPPIKHIEKKEDQQQQQPISSTKSTEVASAEASSPVRRSSSVFATTVPVVMAAAAAAITTGTIAAAVVIRRGRSGEADDVKGNQRGDGGSKSRRGSVRSKSRRGSRSRSTNSDRLSRHGGGGSRSSRKHEGARGQSSKRHEGARGRSRSTNNDWMSEDEGSGSRRRNVKSRTRHRRRHRKKRH